MGANRSKRDKTGSWTNFVYGIGRTPIFESVLVSGSIVYANIPAEHNE